MTRNTLAQTNKRTLLGSKIDPITELVIQEVEHMVRLTLDQEISRLQSRLTKSDQALADIRSDLAEIKGSLSANPDDKYSLTRAKLVRLMKAHGIE